MICLFFCVRSVGCNIRSRSWIGVFWDYDALEMLNTWFAGISVRSYILVKMCVFLDFMDDLNRSCNIDGYVPVSQCMLKPLVLGKMEFETLNNRQRAVHVN